MFLKITKKLNIINVLYQSERTPNCDTFTVLKKSQLSANIGIIWGLGSEMEENLIHLKRTLN